MFILDHGDPNPLYKQLYNQIREHVLQGKLGPDAKLPSVRDLAAELSVSRNTVEGAYQELYAEGYLYTRPRSGYFVSPLDPGSAPVPLQRPAKAGGDAELPSPFRYDFHPARLDPGSFPSPLWRKCFLDTLHRHARELSQYPPDLQGEWSLRCRIRQYLEASRGVVCDPEQVVVCGGLQQSLDIVAQLLREGDRSVAVENPGYHLPRAVFRNHRYHVVPVPVGAQGIDLDALNAAGCAIAYLTPSHQLPMGYVMPVANRLRLIEWAENGKFIIEDDYDSELRYQGKPIPSLQGLRPGGNIIYVGTFSKILSPALRVSYLVLPQALLSRYREMFRDYFSPVSVLEQLTLGRFMELGHWDRHVRRMRTVYRRKHDAILESIGRHFGAAATVVGQGAGLHVVLKLRGAEPDEGTVIRGAAEHGIYLFPFSLTCDPGEASGTTLLLGFGGMTPDESDRGVGLLRRVLFNPGNRESMID